MKFIYQVNQSIQNYGARLTFDVYACVYGVIFVFLFSFTLFFSSSPITTHNVLRLMGKCSLCSLYMLLWLQWSLVYLDDFFMYMLPGFPLVIVLFVKIWKVRRKIKEVCKRIMEKDFWN